MEGKKKKETADRGRVERFGENLIFSRSPFSPKRIPKPHKQNRLYPLLSVLSDLGFNSMDLFLSRNLD